MNRWLRRSAVCLAFLLFAGLITIAAQAATVLGAYATVNVPQLNVRSTPATSSTLLMVVNQAASLPVIGRTPDCAWLQVVTPEREVGWIAAEYVILSQRCQDLPAVKIAEPTRAAQSTPAANRFIPATRTENVPAGPVAATPTTPAPVVTGGSCGPGTNEQFGSLTISSAPTDRPAVEHPDINLARRGYQITDQPTALMSFGPVHDVDLQAPQLRQLFADQRHAAVRSVAQVFDWDWGCNCKGAALSYPPVTLVGLATNAGERLLLPDSPRTIGDGYEALVLYATADQITLKFTREDNVISGYTLHVMDVCVEPALVTLYNSLNQAGRAQLPAVRGGQVFGSAMGDQVRVAIRDNGQFLDPRYLENWWR